MKGFRLIILLLSILLLTISSGLLFYKNLFLLDSIGQGGKIDFEDLHSADLHANATASMLRLNLNSDVTPLDTEITRIKELLNIVTDVNKSTPELSASIVKIQSYFDKKIADITIFQSSLRELKKAIDTLAPSYNELMKNKIKFSVDNKDFYRECMLDSLYYVSSASRENELRLLEDKKILSQILSFANSPNPIILKFSNNIETILKKTKDIDDQISLFNKDNSINSELATVGAFYRESQNSKTHEGEVFLSMIFGAIVLYLITVVVILRKLT
ncbi:MAG: hypothetical protein Q7U04_12500 [Bacteriovorax sp.]|nr:hypothetical protein [Bacteriovorax sp.]